MPVVVTFSVLGDLVRNVGGDYVTVTVLAGGGVDSHTFSPGAADAAALADARLVFENGLGFEPWLVDLYQASGSHAALTVVTEGLPLISADEPTTRGAGGGAQSGLQGYDPHVWHSAANAITMTQKIRDALVQADPANAAAYAANAEAYSARLRALDDWVMAQASALPAERRKLVTTHDTLAYFAQRYGFEVVGTVLPATTEGASPSAQDFAALVEAVRAAGVPAVFAENVSSDSLLNQIAAEAGVEVVATLYTDALGPPGSGVETYIDMMRSNVTTITTALGD